MAKQLLLLVRRHKREFGLVAGALAIIVVLVAGFLIKVMASEDRALNAKNEAEFNLVAARKTLEDRRILGRQAAPEFLAKAQRLMDAGDWKGALTALDVTFRLHKHYPEAWHLKARLHLGAYELSAAAHALAQPVAVDPQGLRPILERYIQLAAKTGGELSVDQRRVLAEEVQRAGDAAVAARMRAALERRGD